MKDEISYPEYPMYTSFSGGRGTTCLGELVEVCWMHRDQRLISEETLNGWEIRLIVWTDFGDGGRWYADPETRVPLLRFHHLEAIWRDLPKWVDTLIVERRAGIRGDYLSVSEYQAAMVTARASRFPTDQPRPTEESP